MPSSAYTTHIFTGLQGGPSHCRHAGQGAAEILPFCQRTVKCGEWGWHQETAQAWLEGMIWAMPCPCSLFSPPSFMISIKVCCFVNAAGVVGPAPAGHMDSEGGETRKWSGVGGHDARDLKHPCPLLFLVPGSFLPTEEHMEPSRGLPLRMLLRADSGQGGALGCGRMQPSCAHWGDRDLGAPACPALQATPALLSDLTWSSGSVTQKSSCLAVCPQRPWLAPGPLPKDWLAA